MSNSRLAHPRHSCARVNMSLKWPTVAFCRYCPFGTSVIEETPLLCINVPRSEALTTFLIKTLRYMLSSRLRAVAVTFTLHMLCSNQMPANIPRCHFGVVCFSVLLQSVCNHLSPRSLCSSPEASQPDPGHRLCGSVICCGDRYGSLHLCPP
jgi:hypothetical protein